MIHLSSPFDPLDAAAVGARASGMSLATGLVRDRVRVRIDEVVRAGSGLPSRLTWCETTYCMVKEPAQ